MERPRPQNPVKPYPYREEDVTYANKTAGNRLAATLTIPPRKGPFPAVLLIVGSGPHDRDESLIGHKPFLVLADCLTRKGIVVLRAESAAWANPQETLKPLRPPILPTMPRRASTISKPGGGRSAQHRPGG